MYNKIFTKILDSSIWLEPDATRIVWLTCIAAMDEDGFVQFAGIANLARRANVSLDAATEAVGRLEGPDTDSSDPDHDGRRLERVDGGWIVLNAEKYRSLVTRVVAREQIRERVKRFRARKNVTGNGGNAGNAKQGKRNAPVTPSEAVSEAEAVSHSEAKTDTEKKELSVVSDDAFSQFWLVYPKKVGKDDARKAWAKRKPDLALVLSALVRQSEWLAREGGQFVPNPSTWITQGRWQDEPPTPTTTVSATTQHNLLARERVIQRLAERKR